MQILLKTMLHVEKTQVVKEQNSKKQIEQNAKMACLKSI